MSDKSKILIVDDEPDILEFISYNLEKEGYNVKVASSAKAALKTLKKWTPKLMILDIMMPEVDGIELCSQLRDDEDMDDVMIVFLSARNESYTQISAFDMGADDFITKPISPKLLRSKVNALFRRYQRTSAGSNPTNKSMNFGELTIIPDEFKVTVGEDEINMAKKELELLLLLVSAPGKVFKREEILRKVWGKEVIVGDRTIDVHIRKLREKIGKSYIKTLKGVGYKFKY